MARLAEYYELPLNSNVDQAMLKVRMESSKSIASAIRSLVKFMNKSGSVEA